MQSNKITSDNAKNKHNVNTNKMTILEEISKIICNFAGRAEEFWFGPALVKLDGASYMRSHPITKLFINYCKLDDGGLKSAIRTERRMCTLLLNNTDRSKFTVNP